MHEIQDAKQNIIQQKMDTLFGYISEGAAVGQFKEKLSEYNTTSDMYKSVLEKYSSVYDNQERKTQLSRKLEEQYRLQENFQKMVDEYSKTGSREALTQAMNLYIQELEPVIHSIRLLKYSVNNVDVAPGWSILSDVSKLTQYEVGPYERDFVYGEPARVQKFHV